MFKQNQTPSETIIYGRHPVLEAIHAGKPIHKVLFQEGVRGELEKEVRHTCKQFDVPLQIVPKERLNKFTRGNHQGIVGFISLAEFGLIENLLPALFESQEVPLLLILDGVTDVRNFGAIARSAEVCGAHAIIQAAKNAAHINEDALKTSAGALTRIPVCRESSLITTIGYLQNSGVKVVASDLTGRKKIMEVDFTVPIAIVIGSEGEGVSQAILNRVNERFLIPQAGKTDSFNVSVAAGIMLYEAIRQRQSV
ncbi:MAG: 23S rRNA (guanosine(2251)-2'-O)-methyltransferase RlmB [Saprospiraceae bacterium]